MGFEPTTTEFRYMYFIKRVWHTSHGNWFSIYLVYLGRYCVEFERVVVAGSQYARNYYY